MLDLWYQQHWKDETNFYVPEKYACLEVVTDINGNTSKFDEQARDEPEMLAWACEETKQSPNTFRAKIIFPEDKTDEEDTALFSQNGLKRLQDNGLLWPPALRTLCNWQEVAQVAVEPLGSDSPTRLRLVLRDSCFRTVWSYDCVNRVLFAVMADSNLPLEVQELVKTWLREESQLITHPVALPLLLVHDWYMRSRRELNKCTRKIRRQQDALGMSPKHKPGPEAENPDYAAIVKELTAVLAKVSWEKDNFDIMSLHLTQLRELADAFAKACPSQPESLNEEIKQRLKTFEVDSSRDSLWARRVQAEVQSLVQTVYCLIGTEDNKQNYRAAEASLKLTEESRTIAQQSVHVAVMTRRDSTDMRVIAAVTLVFLPGTFVATFFSSTFLDFLDNDSGTKVSGFGIGLYFGVTIALTIIVLLSWYTVSRYQVAQDASLLGTLPLPILNGAQAETQSNDDSDVSAHTAARRIFKDWRRLRGRSSQEKVSVSLV